MNNDDVLKSPHSFNEGGKMERMFVNSLHSFSEGGRWMVLCL